MFLSNRSAGIVSGKESEGREFLREMAQFLNDRHGLDIQTMVQVAGAVNRVRWSCNFENLEDHAKKMRAVLADPLYHQLIQKGAEFFNSGQTDETVWQVLTLKDSARDFTVALCTCED